MNTFKNICQLLLRVVIVLLIWTVGLAFLGLFWAGLRLKDFIKKE